MWPRFYSHLITYISIAQHKSACMLHLSIFQHNNYLIFKLLLFQHILPVSVRFEYIIWNVAVTDSMKYIQIFFFFLSYFMHRKENKGANIKVLENCYCMILVKIKPPCFFFYVCDNYELCNCGKSKHKLIQCFGLKNKMDRLKWDDYLFI